MKLREHLDKVTFGNIAPRVVEHPARRAGDGARYVAWFPTWEGPARPDYAAAFADMADRLHARPSR